MNKRHVQHVKPVDSTQVRSALVRVLMTYIPLDWDARDVDETTAWNILLYASSHQTTIEATIMEPGVSSGTTIRTHLTEALGDSSRQVPALEQRLNQALRAQLRRSFRRHLNSQPYDVAMDLVDLPYYGQAHRYAQEVRRGPVKAGTTYFHSYATIAIVHDHQRYELALTFVWAKESLTDVMLRLVKSLRLLGSVSAAPISTKASPAWRFFGSCGVIGFPTLCPCRYADTDCAPCVADAAII